MYVVLLSATCALQALYIVGLPGLFRPVHGVGWSCSWRATHHLVASQGLKIEDMYVYNNEKGRVLTLQAS